MTTAHSARPQVRYLSIGLGHDPAPQADLVFDVRDWFRDPNISEELRKLTGRHFPVIANVLATPGVVPAIDRLHELVAILATAKVRKVVVVVGCMGGKHRSVVISDQLTARGLAAGWDVTVEHRDIDKPILPPRVTAA